MLRWYYTHWFDLHYHFTLSQTHRCIYMFFYHFSFLMTKLETTNVHSVINDVVARQTWWPIKWNAISFMTQRHGRWKSNVDTAPKNFPKMAKNYDDAMRKSVRWVFFCFFIERILWPLTNNSIKSPIHITSISIYSAWNIRSTCVYVGKSTSESRKG